MSDRPAPRGGGPVPRQPTADERRELRDLRKIAEEKGAVNPTPKNTTETSRGENRGRSK